MSDDQSAEKTEEASEKRREEFRERGELAQSKDIISVLILFSGLGYFVFFGGHIYDGMNVLFRRYFGFRPEVRFDVNGVMALGEEAVLEIAYIIAPLVGLVFVVSILGNMAQVGVLFTTKPMEPDLNKLNFFTRFLSTFFNKQAFGNLVTSIVKILIVALVIYLTLRGDGDYIKVISTLTLHDGVAFLLGRCMEVLFNVCIVLIFVAIADYAWNKYVMEEKMKMSLQEVKDEQKEYEGNPHMKGQMRRRAMDMANNRMMQAVPDADVIVNNPTHISVAIRYRQGEDGAPVILAKGADLMAMRIRRIAKAHGIPMVENKPLARSLYRNVKVGRPVPSKFFRAVAEVLAYVYRLRKQRGLPMTRGAGGNTGGNGVRTNQH